MKKEAKREKENLKNQKPPGKIIYISFNDWDDEFESEKCKKFLDSFGKGEDYPFEWDLGIYDKAAVFAITTTEEDLKEYGYEEFLKCKVDLETDKFALWRYAEFFQGVKKDHPFPSYKNPRYKDVRED